MFNGVDVMDVVLVWIDYMIVKLVEFGLVFCFVVYLFGGLMVKMFVFDSGIMFCDVVDVFLDYFVRQRCAPEVTEIRFSGIEKAQPSSEFEQLLSGSRVTTVIICPSNPFVGIDPILSIPPR